MSPEEGRPHREGWSNWTEEETRQNARAYAVPPGVCLIVVALLGCFMDLAQVVMFAVISENAYDRMPKFFGQNEPLATVRPPAMIVGGAGACLSLVILLAGIQTCRLRTYPFAVLGAVLAMLNCVNLCCALGLPAGLWSFIILMRQDVRAGFQ
jgi:hypothetical protein